MEVKVNSRSGKELGSFAVEPSSTTVAEFKKIFTKRFTKWTPDRQWFTVGGPRGAVLKEDNKYLAEYLKGEKELCFKDLGLQMSWRLVYVIEYAGPIIIHSMLYFFPKIFYGQQEPRTFTQHAGFWMLLGHFVKRELESLYVHRFSSSTMPITRLPINCGHYWLLNGLLIGWYFFHPLYTEPSFNPNIKWALVGLFTVFEGLNAATHLTLRDLRKPGSKDRGIPKGFGFDYVSCANYLWEIGAWASFTVLSKCATSYVFLAASVFILIKWAKERHNRYKKEFDGKEGRELYPKSRTALIPFLLCILQGISKFVCEPP